MSEMFSGCKKLRYLNFSNFKTDKVNNMSYMFYGCSSLKDLDISNFEFNSLTSMYQMFFGCSHALRTKVKEQNKKLRDEAFI